MEESVKHCVLISHAHEDTKVAELLRVYVRQESPEIFVRTVALASGDSLEERMRGSMGAGDYLLVLLSRHTAESRWLHEELAEPRLEDLERRDILFLPVLIDECQLPVRLKRRIWQDISAGTEARLHEFARRLPGVLRMDFSTLTAERFEELVFDLLKAQGLSPTTLQPGELLRIPVGPAPLGHRWPSREPETAYLCTPHQEPERESSNFLVQAKFYSVERADLASLAGLRLTCRERPRTQGMVFTNSQLTSATRRWLAAVDTGKSQVIIVFEGPHLKRMLLNYPDLVEKHFPVSEGGDADPR
jgi:hypothetical protein